MEVFVLTFMSEVQAFKSANGAKRYAQDELGVTVKRLDSSNWMGYSALDHNILRITKRTVFDK